MKLYLLKTLFTPTAYNIRVSTCLCNRLPVSLRQPHPSLSSCDSFSFSALHILFSCWFSALTINISL